MVVWRFVPDCRWRTGSGLPCGWCRRRTSMEASLPVERLIWWSQVVTEDIIVADSPEVSPLHRQLRLQRYHSRCWHCPDKPSSRFTRNQGWKIRRCEESHSSQTLVQCYSQDRWEHRLCRAVSYLRSWEAQKLYVLFYRCVMSFISVNISSNSMLQMGKRFTVWMLQDLMEDYLTWPDWMETISMSLEVPWLHLIKTFTWLSPLSQVG